MLIPWYALEYPRLTSRFLETSSEVSTEPASRTLLAALHSALALSPGGAGTVAADAVVLLLNAFCTFALNLSVFLVLLHTSALTIRVAGVVKDWLVVLVSALVFADTRLTPINVFGYAVGKGGGRKHRRYCADTRL